jgi:hypothetical protein
MGWVVSVTPRPRFTPGTHCTGGWVGPRAGLDTEARGKILCPCRGSNFDLPVVQPVVRHYTVWAIKKSTTVYRFCTNQPPVTSSLISSKYCKKHLLETIVINERQKALECLQKTWQKLQLHVVYFGNREKWCLWRVLLSVDVNYFVILSNPVRNDGHTNVFT